jgi:hypothetical protein
MTSASPAALQIQVLREHAGHADILREQILASRSPEAVTNGLTTSTGVPRVSRSGASSPTRLLHCIDAAGSAARGERPLQGLDGGVPVGHITERCAFRSPIEIGDSNALCHGCKAPQIVGVARGDDRPSAQVSVGQEEGIDRHLRPGADRSEQLPGSHAHATVDMVDLDPLTSQTGEHADISRSTADHFGEDSRDRCDRQVPRSHLHHECSDPIPATIRPVGNRRDGLAVEQEHSTGLRWSVTGGCPVVHDARGPLERLRVDRAMFGIELGEPPVDDSEVPEPGQMGTHRLVDRRRQTANSSRSTRASGSPARRPERGDRERCDLVREGEPGRPGMEDHAR